MLISKGGIGTGMGIDSQIVLLAISYDELAVLACRVILLPPGGGIIELQAGTAYRTRQTQGRCVCGGVVDFQLCRWRRCPNADVAAGVYAQAFRPIRFDDKRLIVCCAEKVGRWIRRTIALQIPSHDCAPFLPRQCVTTVVHTLSLNVHARP